MTRLLAFPTWRDVEPDRWPWPNFSPFEMRCRCEGTPHEIRCGCGGQVVVSPSFMDRLQELRGHLGFALSVTSGFRTPEYDRAIGGAGVHPEGCAADIAISGERAYLMDIIITEMGFRGVGRHQRGLHSDRFIHIDDLDIPSHPRPRIWTY